MSCSSVTKIACVGDSITEGAGLVWQSKTSYPVILDSILGSKYSVLNLGRSATTLQRKGDFPYWTAKEFYDVFEFDNNDVRAQSKHIIKFLSTPVWKIALSLQGSGTPPQI